MNYEKITLEMLERIKVLEEKVEMLEQNSEKIDKIDEVKQAFNNTKESGRTLSRLEIMKILKEDYGLEVRKGNRGEGGGVVISRNGKLYNVKISYSQSYFKYINEDVICSGWNTLFRKEVENQDLPFFIFAIADDNNEFHYFIFKREDILKEFDYKVYDTHNKMHFYFRLTKEGRAIELREIEKDIKAYYNNWSIFDELNQQL